jgi:hypothetical protein
LTPKEIFNRQIDELVRQLVDPINFDTVKLAGALRSDGLTSARKGLLQLSKEQLNEARVLSARLGNGRSYALQNGFQLAAEAYWYYKNKEPELAIEALDEARNIDALLIRDYSYEILVAHIVQLVANKLRVVRRFHPVYEQLLMKRAVIQTAYDILGSERFLNCVLGDETKLVVSQIVIESFGLIFE